MRFAHRFFVLWGTIAALCFAVSGFMTWLVVRTYPHAQPYFVGIYGSPGLKHHAGEVQYYLLSRPVWIVTYPSGTHSVLLPGAASILCTDARGTLVNGPLGMSQNVQRSSQRWLSRQLIQRWSGSDGFDVSEINVARLQSPYIGGRIACFIDVRPNRESLTNSSFGIEFLRQIIKEQRIEHLEDVRAAGVVHPQRAALLVVGDRLDHRSENVGVNLRPIQAADV
jgi:hypothetical protein